MIVADVRAITSPTRSRVEVLDAPEPQAALAHVERGLAGHGAQAGAPVDRLVAVHAHEVEHRSASVGERATASGAVVGRRRSAVERDDVASACRTARRSSNPSGRLREDDLRTASIARPPAVARGAAR